MNARPRFQALTFEQQETLLDALEELIARLDAPGSGTPVVEHTLIAASFDEAWLVWSTLQANSHAGIVFVTELWSIARLDP